MPNAMSNAMSNVIEKEVDDEEEEYDEDEYEPEDDEEGGARMSLTNVVNVAAYVVNTAITYTSLTGIFGATNTELSKKYQTLLTPAGWAFAIWGPIFIWEGVFVVAQLCPRYRQSQVVLKVSPHWWALCIFQVAWTFAFARDNVTLALVFMLCILASLSGISWSTDGMRTTCAEYFLLRAPFSLHLGWILVASALNLNVHADASKASQEYLLGLAVISIAGLLAVAAIFTFAIRSPDPLIGLVAAWAFAAIHSELKDPTNLNDPARFNASIWDSVILGGLQRAALGVSMLSILFAVVAAFYKIYSTRQDGE